MANDKYRNFTELLSVEKEGIDYIIEWKNRNTKWCIIAPHGGGIEPATSEIVSAVAGINYSYYIFGGIKKSKNSNLHITSEFFDEKGASEILQSAEYAITLHGCAGYDNKILVGGLDLDNREKLTLLLTNAGFDADNNPPDELSGVKPDNICNRCLSGNGVQLELDISVRKSMFRGLDRKGRKMPLPPFYKFVSVIKGFIEQ